MELELYSDRDLWLTEALETDPVAMEHLGGPVPRDEIAQIHKRRAEGTAEEGWFFTIVPDPATGPVGTVGIWETEWEGATVHETGWMILPAFQGRGLASAGLQKVLDMARADGRFAHIHAFPAIVNEASNAMCRRFGFTLVGECAVAYRGDPKPSNHWRLDL